MEVIGRCLYRKTHPKISNALHLHVLTCIFTTLQRRRHWGWKYRGISCLGIMTQCLGDNAVIFENDKNNIIAIILWWLAHPTGYLHLHWPHHEIMLFLSFSEHSRAVTEALWYYFSWTCTTSRAGRFRPTERTETAKAPVFLSYIGISDESATIPKKCSFPLKFPGDGEFCEIHKTANSQNSIKCIPEMHA